MLFTGKRPTVQAISFASSLGGSISPVAGDRPTHIEYVSRLIVI